MAKAGFKGIGSDEDIKQADAAIDAYVNDINKTLDALKDPEIERAFRGKYAKAAQEFISIVMEDMKKPVEQLREFRQKLAEAKQRYARKDEDVSASFKTSNASTESN